jgi:hypothetical protein
MWQHSIPPVKELRYAIMMRTLRGIGEVSQAERVPELGGRKMPKRHDCLLGTLMGRQGSGKTPRRRSEAVGRDSAQRTIGRASLPRHRCDAGGRRNRFVASASRIVRRVYGTVPVPGGGRCPPKLGIVERL